MNPAQPGLHLRQEKGVFHGDKCDRQVGPNRVPGDSTAGTIHSGRVYRWPRSVIGGINLLNDMIDGRAGSPLVPVPRRASITRSARLRTSSIRSPVRMGQLHPSNNLEIDLRVPFDLLRRRRQNDVTLQPALCRCLAMAKPSPPLLPGPQKMAAEGLGRFEKVCRMISDAFLACVLHQNDRRHGEFFYGDFINHSNLFTGQGKHFLTFFICPT